MSPPESGQCGRCHTRLLNIIVRNSGNNNPVPGATITVRSDDESIIVVDGLAVGSDGRALIEVPQMGNYSVKILADGFITVDLEIEVKCTAAGCQADKLVAMSPELEAGETRIIMTWEKAQPTDLNIHVMSVKKSGGSMCRTFYGDKNGCTQISLDLDNTSGGLNGAETVTLLDNNVNKDYVYIIGVEDYRFQASGTLFLESGASISITNGVKTEDKRMVANTVNSDEQ